MDKNAEIVDVHLSALLALLIDSTWDGYLEWLLVDETLTKVSPKYSDDTNVFSSSLAIGLLEHTGMNNYAVNLEEDK